MNENQSNPRMTALRGRYSVAVFEGADLVHEHDFQNLVTQQGRDSFAALSAPELLASCQVGVGQLPVSDEQTKLSAAVGVAALNQGVTVQQGVSADVLVCTFSFPEGSFDNVDLAEVGVFDKSGKLFSRALFKNAQGNLESINVQKAQRVVITYTLQLIRPEAPIEAQLQLADMGGLLHTHSLRVFPQNKPRYVRDTGGVLQEFSPAPASLNKCTVNVITDPTYAGIPGTASNVESLPAPALVLEQYLAGTSSRKFSARIDSQYGNKSSGITGIEVVHPTLGVMLTATVQPAVVKTQDYRFYFDLSLDW